MASNQGQALDELFEDLPLSVMDSAAKIVWREVHNHPDSASCNCLAIEAFAHLYVQGYKIVKA